MAITVEAGWPVSSSAVNANSLTIAGLNVTGSNRYLLVAVCCGQEGYPQSVTFDGVALTAISNIYNANYLRLTIFHLPQSGLPLGTNKSLIVTLPAGYTTRIVVGAILYSNVDQVTPYAGVVSTPNGSGKYPTRLVAGVPAGSLPVVCMIKAPGINETVVIDSPAVEYYSARAVTGTSWRVLGAAGYKTTSGDVTISWTGSVATAWMTTGFYLNPSAGGTPVSQTAAVNLESLLASSAMATASVESLLTLETYAASNVEALLSPVATRTSNLEGLPLASQSAPENLEALLRLTPTALANLEGLRPVSQTRTMNLEARLDVIQTRAINLEALTAIAQYAIVNLEGLGLALPTVVSQTAILNLEALAQIARVQAANLEALLSLNPTRLMNLEALLSVSQTRGLNLEALPGGLAKTSAINLEALLNIAVTRTANLEGLRPLSVQRQANLEALLAVSGVAILNIEGKGTVIVVDWTPFGTILGSDTVPLVIQQIDASLYPGVQWRLTGTIFTTDPAIPGKMRLAYSDDGAIWTEVAGSEISSFNTSPTLVISGPFTLTGNRLYCVQKSKSALAIATVGFADLVGRPS